MPALRPFPWQFRMRLDDSRHYRAGPGEAMVIDLRDGNDADRVDGEGAVEARYIRKAHRRVLDRQVPGRKCAFEQLLTDTVERRSGRLLARSKSGRRCLRA
jgi:hypothetical protein